MDVEGKLSRVAKRLTPSPIQQLSFLAQRCNAISLAEGFPDFPAPQHIKAAAVSAITSDFNQYRLRHLLQQFLQGEEVILFDPSYETYSTCISMAGGVPVYVSLDPPNRTLDPEKLLKSFTVRTKAIVLNSPHNPTGKVFTEDELEIIAGACRTWDCLAVTDEVYEHITYDEEQHISLAVLPGMQKRTIITSSLSKTFSITGWRVGWAIAPACIASAIRNIHIKLTDSAPAPFQEAALTALTSCPEFFKSLKKISGFVLVVLGVPLLKPLYTLSYMCITAGASGFLLTIIFYIVDVKHIRKPMIILQWVGMNALIIYALAACDVFPAAVQKFYWHSPESNLVDGTESLLQAMLHSAKWGTGAFVTLEILFWGVVAGFLNMKRLYIRL